MELLLGFFRRLTNSSLAGEIIVATIIVVCTGIAVRIITRVMRDFVKRVGRDLPSSSIFINIVRAAVWLMGLSLALSTCFGIDVSALIAALGVGGIAVSLGFRDTISNLIGGLQVSMLGIVAPGDNVSVGSVKGIVQDITWRQTVVKAADGHIIIIPNSVINAQTLEKYPPITTVRVPVSVASDGRNLTEAAAAIEAAALSAARSVGEVVKPPHLFFTSINEMAVNGTLVYEMAEPSVVTDATDAIIKAIAPYARDSYEEGAASA